MPEPLTPDEIEQRQSAVPDDEDESTFDDADGPLSPDEIEQRQSVGWDDEDQPID